MGLTQVSTKGIKDATLLNEDVNASADIAGSKLADNSISLAKLLHGDSNNNGKFLRANNGADPTFETVTGTTINNNADNRVITGSGTANTLNAESGVVIDSAGRLLVGTTTDNGFKLKVSDGGGYEFAFAPNDSGVNSLVNYNRSGSAYVPFKVIGSDLRFGSGGDTERMRIDSSGKVGIGTTSPQVTGIHINGSSARLQLTDSTTGTGSGDGVIFGLNGDQDFFINNRESSKNLIFFTANSEVLRIDSSGRVGIGLTPVNRILHTSSASSASRIQIDNTTNSNGLQIGADGNGSFQSTLSANDHLIYTNGGLRARWTANGLCFNGDTAAANALDDYEEGDITLTLSGSNGGSINYSYRTGHYTKIGNICTVSGDIRFSGSWSGSSGDLLLALPFSSESTGGAVGGGIVFEWNTSSSSKDNIMIKVDNNESVARFTAHDDSGNNNTGAYSTGDLANNRYLKFVFTYQTA